MKDQPGGCRAPAEGEDVADLAEDDLGGEDLGEDEERADEDQRRCPAEYPAGSDQRYGEGNRADEEREQARLADARFSIAGSMPSASCRRAS